MAPGARSAALEVSLLPLRLVQMQFSPTTKDIFPEMGKYLDPSGAASGPCLKIDVSFDFQYLQSDVRSVSSPAEAFQDQPEVSEGTAGTDERHHHGPDETRFWTDVSSSLGSWKTWNLSNLLVLFGITCCLTLTGTLTGTPAGFPALILSVSGLAC